MVNVKVYGYSDRYETEGSYLPVSVTIDGIDTSKGRLWTTTTGSLHVTNTVTTTESEFALKLIETGSLTFIGKVSPSYSSATGSAVWQIKRINEIGTGSTYIQYADGNVSYDNVWDNIKTLNYI